MEDYLYVSARKVDRMSSSLPPKIRKRLQELQVTLGPVGGGVKLAEMPSAPPVESVQEIGRLIYETYPVRHFADPDVRAGDWIMGDQVPMVYGSVDANPYAKTTAIGDAAAFGLKFVVHDVDCIMVLIGSAENLLDRSNPPTQPGLSMSDPQAITRLLRARDQEGATPDFYGSTDFYPMYNILRELEQYGSYPLKFLARALRVHELGGLRDKQRSLLGTPLFVAHDQRTLEA